MLRSMLFQRSGGDRSFIPGDYSRQRTEDGRVQDGRRGGLTNKERKTETEEGERDSERDKMHVKCKLFLECFRAISSFKHMFSFHMFLKDWQIIKL